MKKSVRWLMVIGPATLLALPIVALAANLLTNGNFETFSDIPGRSWNGINEKVGTGWTHFYVASGTRLDKLHWFSSQDFAVAFGGLNYRLEGSYAQNMWSAYEFDAGVYQRMTGLVTGTVYAFDVPIVTYWRGPGYPDSDGMMKKWIGIDPTGGTDPTSSNVVWSDVDSNDKAWVYMDLAARAESSAMTFFVRIQAPENSSVNHTDLDMVYVDAAKVDLAPTVILSATVNNTDVTFSWTASAAPGWSVKGVEVEYRDEAGGNWQTLQGKTGNGDSNYTFSGQRGHTYTVRARPWQTMVETYNSDIDMPGLWVEQSVTVGGAFNGYVQNNFGIGISGATLAVAGGGSTTSGQRGFYALEPPSYGQAYTLTVSASDYGPPPPISAAVADADSVTPITFTLKPADDVITNGDFEIDTSGWITSGTGSAAVFGGGHRSGLASLAMTDTITLTRTVAISGVYNPTLSFWHNPALGGSDSFEVSLSQGATVLVSKVFTAGTAAGWQHVWLPLDRPNLYTGSLTVSFQLTGGQVSLDEVSLGKGPYTIFLPVIFVSTGP